MHNLKTMSLKNCFCNCFNIYRKATMQRSKETKTNNFHGTLASTASRITNVYLSRFLKKEPSELENIHREKRRSLMVCFF